LKEEIKMNVFMIIIGILAIIAGVVAPTVLQERTDRSRRRYGEEPKKVNKAPWRIMIAIGIILFALGNSFEIIPTGYTGVRTTFGQISQETVPNGLCFKIPFVQDIKQVNNKQQDTTIKATVWGETKEKTPVYATDIVVSYQIAAEKSAWLYANVTNVDSLVDDKIVASAVKSAMVELTVETVTNRSYIEPSVAAKLQEALDEKYGEYTVVVKTVVVNDMDFEESYNAAIAEKSIAAQNQQRQEIENQTAIARAEAEKQVAIANAQAEAESLRIATEAKAEALLIEAEAQAEANRKLAESITDDIINNKIIEKWDGKLPVVSGDSDTIIDFGSLTE
jgi:regulator of protease activity HflC (stomatin/prohibitin superfamily)